MTDDPRSPKRPRLSVSPRAILIVSPGDSSGSESDAAGEEKYTRDLDFWLDDGNLILLAGRSAFRVYRGLLVKNSPVFADMFTTGSAGATETFDNCPVVRLADHPQNLRDFLQYLMPCSALVLVEEVPECRFEQLHAAFHLAHKYQCQDVEARILFVLKKFYTSNFNDHDRYATSKYTLVPPPPQAAIAAVNIARLTSTLSMLPFALYLVCTLEGRAVDGYERRDGSAEHLSAEDLKLCMNARGTLAWELAALTKTVFSSTEYPSLQCMHPDSCVVAEDTMFCETQESVPGGCDVLESYRESVDEWAKAYGMCKGCKRKLLARDREERRKMWIKLPGVFGFTVQACGFTNVDE
ncbi:hypothetical protein GSI_11927 [Ganoderma sinense ZZ0214-1]|uniref:BTB domain-containing protein n=1 Tax=Ganoderma sinense ZZ0214-1 TaxID=1077348 RepID=A0A2G8RXE1_9APHY|nr:hypothetical protein GSI_11927 [Ganoderma sinense ZZ0214-1]